MGDRLTKAERDAKLAEARRARAKECPTCGAMANPKGVHGFAPDGSLFCPGWSS